MYFHQEPIQFIDNLLSALVGSPFACSLEYLQSILLA
jgi:hypothetical protein